jgi:hypothetical protein
VTALALFADDDYEEAARLTEALRGVRLLGCGLGGADPGRDPQTRQRLGPEPLAGVFS